jgi:hypothetical protein
MAAPLILKIIVFSVAKKVTVFLIAKVSAIFRDLIFFFFFFFTCPGVLCFVCCLDLLLHLGNAVFSLVQMYGIPRVYRRMAELNRYLNQNNPARRQSVSNGMQFMFRLPRNILSTFRRWTGGVSESHLPPPPLHRSPSSSSSSSSQQDHHQVRRFHTASRYSQAHIYSHARSFSGLLQEGLFVVNQSMRSHLLGQRREEKPHTNLLRQWSSSMNALLPFGTQVFGFSANFAGRKEEPRSKSAKDMLSWL